MKNQGISSIFFTVGLLLAISCTKEIVHVPEVTVPSNALVHYVNNEDASFSWELQNEYSIIGVKAYDILLTSQTWQDTKWIHQLTIMIPPSVAYNDALLYITGGSVKNGEIDFKNGTDAENFIMALVASQNNAITVVIRQTPVQPLYNGLTEDALISFTLNNYLNDGDLTWPLLFPMVKTAVKAMDATQEFSQEKLGITLNNFLVTGASKRGWTTWLTGAIDNRVNAIAPMVIDMLNMPISIPYHLETWGDYSPQIQDYVDLGLTEELSSGQGNGADLVTMIDPYSYRDALTMPKLILLGTNDPYWPTDAIKNYFDDILGTNFIHNVPNAGHGLGVDHTLQAINALSAFFGYTLSGKSYPACSWNMGNTTNNYQLSVSATGNQLVDAVYWSSTSADRDFRDNEWISQSLNGGGKSTINYEGTYPSEGFQAFFIALMYKDLNGKIYSKSTRVFVANTSEIL